jgi:hypothetical protein
MKINSLDLNIVQAVKDEMTRLLESLDNNKDDFENVALETLFARL